MIFFSPVVFQDSEVTYFHSYIDGVDFVFIEAPPFRHRHNDIYGGERLVNTNFQVPFLTVENSIGDLSHLSKLCLCIESIDGRIF